MSAKYDKKISKMPSESSDGKRVNNMTDEQIVRACLVEGPIGSD